MGKISVAGHFEKLVDHLLATLVDAPGTLTSEVRRAILRRAAAVGGGQRDGGDTPEGLVSWVDKIAKHAYRTTADDVAALTAAGVSEDQIFEATLCASVGAAWARLDRGLAVLRAGKRPA